MSMRMTDAGGPPKTDPERGGRTTMAKTIRERVQGMRAAESDLWQRTFADSDGYQKALGLTSEDLELLEERKGLGGWPSVQDHLVESCVRVRCDDGTEVGITVHHSLTPSGWKTLLKAGIVGEHPADLQTGRGTTLTFVLPPAVRDEVLQSLKDRAYQCGDEK
jgi:hypothetical protein